MVLGVPILKHFRLYHIVNWPIVWIQPPHRDLCCLQSLQNFGECIIFNLVIGLFNFSSVFLLFIGHHQSADFA